MSRRSVLARQQVMLLIAVVFYVWLVYYAVTGDTGPIGWLNALQTRMGGGYSRKLSLLLLLVISALPVSVVWLLLWPTEVPPPEPPDPSVPPAKPMSGFAQAVISLVVLEAIIWGATIGYGLWEVHGQNVDAEASYVPLVLSAGTPNRASEGDHFGVRGRLLGDHVVTRTEGSSSNKIALVPLVEPHWSDGDPVHLLLSVDNDRAATVRDTLRSNDGVLLVRVEGAVPSAALDVFTRMKAPIADDARTVAFVPSAGGRPSAAPSELDWKTIAIPGWIGTACVVMLYGLFVILPLLGSRAKRQSGKAERNP